MLVLLLILLTSTCFAQIPTTDQAWQAREAVVSSTKFKDSNCITVGFNLHQKDLKFFYSLNSQLIYVESDGIPDVGTMFYYSWCVR